MAEACYYFCIFIGYISFNFTLLNGQIIMMSEGSEYFLEISMYAILLNHCL